jgi:hypothetical protein
LRCFVSITRVGFGSFFAGWDAAMGLRFFRAAKNLKPEA